MVLPSVSSGIQPSHLRLRVAVGMVSSSTGIKEFRQEIVLIKKIQCLRRGLGYGQVPNRRSEKGEGHRRRLGGRHSREDRTDCLCSFVFRH